MPDRIQRLRLSDWRKPEGAVYVGRPTKFGNPFPVHVYGRELAVQLYRNVLTRSWSPAALDDVADMAYVNAYEHMANLRGRLPGDPAAIVRDELAGRDLMCWCRLDEACHADVLLDIANPDRGA